MADLKRGEPDWSLLGVPGAADLPAIRWKQINLDKLPAEHRAKLVAQVEKVLRNAWGRRRKPPIYLAAMRWQLVQTASPGETLPPSGAGARLSSVAYREPGRDLSRCQHEISES